MVDKEGANACTCPYLGAILSLWAKTLIAGAPSIGDQWLRET